MYTTSRSVTTGIAIGVLSLVLNPVWGFSREGTPGLAKGLGVGLLSATTLVGGGGGVLRERT